MCNKGLGVCSSMPRSAEYILYAGGGWTGSQKPLPMVPLEVALDLPPALQEHLCMPLSMAPATVTTLGNEPFNACNFAAVTDRPRSSPALHHAPPVLLHLSQNKCIVEDR